MSDRKQTLKLYGEYSVKLAKLIKSEGQLSNEEQMAIQNHIIIVQLALMISKYDIPDEHAFAA